MTKRPMTTRVTRWAVWGVVVTLGLGGGMPVRASAPPTLPGAVAVSEDDVRLAKAGLGWFLLANVDRPTRVSDPCPTLAVEAAGWYLAQTDLTMSQRPFGAAVVWETEVGAGLVSVRCGIDLSESPEPAESIAWSLDVTMLDGQATFAQYAVFLAGRDVLIDQLPDIRGQIASTCTNGGTQCTAALEVDDLLLILRLKGLPDETGERITRDIVVATLREVAANLGAVPPPQ